MTFPRIRLFLCLVLVPTVCSAQPDFMRYGSPVAPAPADPAIVKALSTIDPSRIDQTIKTLVGYDTRNSLSSMEKELPASKGI